MYRVGIGGLPAGVPGWDIALLHIGVPLGNYAEGHTPHPGYTSIPPAVPLHAEHRHRYTGWDMTEPWALDLRVTLGGGPLASQDPQSLL